MGVLEDPDLAESSSSAQPLHGTSPLKRRAANAFGESIEPTTEAVDRFYNAALEKQQACLNSYQDDDRDLNPKKSPKKRKKPAGEPGEKRLRRERTKMPLSVRDVYERAMSQRMFVLDRERAGTEECPEEIINLAGSTGNIYTIHIKEIPSCNCPHAEKGNQCKHILYVLYRTLKAPEPLAYQLALLKSELRTIFEHAPPILTPSRASSPSASGNGLRKALEDDCPICCCEFDTEAKEDIVWCRSSCGNNVHKACFEQWAATKKRSSYGDPAQVTCPFCRAPWQGDEDSLAKISKVGEKNEDGYVNVAQQLGISGERDYSSYHQIWVRSEMRAGNIPRRYY